MIGVARTCCLSALVLALSISGLSGAAAQQAEKRKPADAAVLAAGQKLIDRTFFAASEGNLRGTIYLGPKAEAIQVDRERGIQRLRWGILKDVEGVAGPAVCLAGPYDRLAAAGKTVIVERSGRPVICSSASEFARIRNSKGNTLGLGTIIQ